MYITLFVLQFIGSDDHLNAMQLSIYRYSENTYLCIKALSMHSVNLLNGMLQYFTCETENLIVKITKNQHSSIIASQHSAVNNEIVASCAVTTGENSELQCSTPQQMLHSNRERNVDRSIGKEKAENEMDQKLQEQNNSYSQPAAAKSTGKYLPAATEIAKNQNPVSSGFLGQNKTTEGTGYTTSTVLGATVSHTQQYSTSFDRHQPPPEEEKGIHNRTDHQDGSTLYGQSHQQILKNQLTSTSKLQSPKPAASSSSNKPKGTFPRRACLVYNNEQYPLDHHLLSQPLATKYLVKVRTEISPGRFMAKLELHCAR